jgi:hypothetical protein
VPSPKWSLACALALFLGTASAQDVLLDTTGAAPGKYILTLAADGTVTVAPLSQVVSLSGQPSPPPPPTGSPFEIQVEQLTKAALAAGGTKTTAAALSSVYSIVADGVASGTIPPSSALSAIKSATDVALAGQADIAAWQSWRTGIGDALTTLQSTFALVTQKQYVATLRAVSSGVNRAIGLTLTTSQIRAIPKEQLGTVNGIDMAKLLELIMRIVLELMAIFKQPM